MLQVLHPIYYSGFDELVLKNVYVVNKNKQNNQNKIPLQSIFIVLSVNEWHKILVQGFDNKYRKRKEGGASDYTNTLFTLSPLIFTVYLYKKNKHIVLENAVKYQYLQYIRN